MYHLYNRLRGYFHQNKIYNNENLLQNQSEISRTVANGEFVNFATPNLINPVNTQINRLERMKDFDQMDEMGEIALALDLYADEATQVDSELKKQISIKTPHLKVKEELECLFFDILNIENKLRMLCRYLCKYGDFPMEIIPQADRRGVASFRALNIYNFTRIETKHNDLVGFYYVDLATGEEPVFLHPWQVVHMRLNSYENHYHPYGKSILDGARMDFRRLRLMEDAALIYRITRAPEKRKFKIPVGNIPPAQVPHYVMQIADGFKRQRFIDPQTGQINYKYNPLIQEDDFWFPVRPDGQGPDVTTMPGAENLDQIKDIEYFKKKMIASTKIPFSRVGIGSEDGVGGSDKSLASTSSEFAKAVQWIQREMSSGLKKLALVHLALKGYGVEEMKGFDIFLTNSSAIDELYRIETWNSRAAVIGSLRETKLFPDKWLLNKFTDMTQDEIDEMQEQSEIEQAANAEAGEEDDGGMELPGLGEASSFDHKLNKKVLMEWQSYSYKKQKSKAKSKKRENFRSPSLQYYLLEGEFNGLSDKKLSPKKKKDTLFEEIESDLNSDVSDDLEFEYLSEEHKETVLEYKKLLIEGQTKIVDCEEIQSMDCPII